MLFLRHVSRYEDSEVADVPLQQANNSLASRFDLLGRAVHVRHPVKGLLRGRMLSPMDAKRMIGVWILRRSNSFPPEGFSRDQTLFPTNSCWTIQSISCRFSR